MTIRIVDGVITWKFYRKAYRKARWRKAGQRQIEIMQKYHGAKDILIVF